MNKLKKLSISLKGFTNALYRFPLTGLFLLIATILNHLDLSGGKGNYSPYVMTLIIGAIITAVGQVIYERGYKPTSNRILIHTMSILLTFIYYYSIARHNDFNMINSVRTIIIILILMVFFIWIPVTKSSLTFNDSIIITFKSFFITLFFAFIIFLGAILINAAIDNLLISTSYKFTGYAANIIFLLYAPIYFLSLIPIYPRVYNTINEESEAINKERLESIVRKSHSDRYLEVLFSYIIIPITGIFTIILILYIIKNIGSSFWTDNLLEPMIVTYSITVILVYLLTSLVNNRITVLFRKIFPKVLIPIVLLQTIASIMKIGDMGITHNRYFVILYGIFTIIAGVVFSILPVKKNGIIAPILIIMSVISITPPVDAFSISLNNQSKMLREVLDRNNMMQNNKVVPNSNISKDDKEIIIQTTNYLRTLDYKDISREVLKDSYGYTDFKKTFGFDYGYNEEASKYYNFNLLASEFINISNYDIFVTTYIQSGLGKNSSIMIGQFDYNGLTYTLEKIDENGQGNIVLFDNKQEEIIRISNDDIINHFLSYNEEYKELTWEEAKVSKENDMTTMTIIVENLYFRKDGSGTVDSDYKDGSIYLLIDFK